MKKVVRMDPFSKVATKTGAVLFACWPGQLFCLFVVVIWIFSKARLCYARDDDENGLPNARDGTGCFLPFPSGIEKSGLRNRIRLEGKINQSAAVEKASQICRIGIRDDWPLMLDRAGQLAESRFV